MSSNRWQTTKKKPNAAQRKAAAQEQARQKCQQGKHIMTPTFRPSETVCLICGFVLYCPVCFQQQQLQVAGAHAHSLMCQVHQKVEVRV